LLPGLFSFAPQVSTHERDEDRLARDLKALETLHQRDIEATKAYDVDALASLWTEDIVALPPGAEPVIGKDANRKLLEAGRAASAPFETMEYEQDWQEIRVAGDFAWERGVFTGAVRPKAGGDVVRYRYNVLRVLRRMPDGSWLVHRTIWNDAAAAK
jgi:ketosteroid isomerase-like protein